MFYDPEWALSTTAMIRLSKVLAHYQPSSIIELGTGLSSHLLIRYAQEYHAGYVGIEADVPYLEKHLVELHEAGLPPMGTLLINRDNVDGFYKASGLKPAKLVLIDGPAGSRFTEKAKEFYKSVDLPETIWIVDDTHRPTEWNLAGWLWTFKPFHPALVVKDEIYPYRTTTFMVPQCLENFDL